MFVWLRFVGCWCDTVGWGMVVMWFAVCVFVYNVGLVIGDRMDERMTGWRGWERK